MRVCWNVERIENSARCSRHGLIGSGGLFLIS